MTISTDTLRAVASLDVQPLTIQAFCHRLLEWAVQRPPQPRLVTYLNAHNVNLALENPDYARVLKRAGLLYADGMGVVWGWRWLGRDIPERISAGDFIREFCRQAAARDLSIYCLGSFPGVAEKAARQWAAHAPGLKIAGARDGFFSPEEAREVAEDVRRAQPAILLVGMGVPRQELWAAQWLDALDVPVVWCVGALFEYFGMKRSRAPGWMRRAGAEWLWRLALEPRRMARRYLIGNWRFLWNLWRMRRAGK